MIPAAVSNLDSTLDAVSPLAIQSRPEVASTIGDRFGIELLEGEGGAIQEANLLLQARLKAAALALGFGSAIFSAWILVQEWLIGDQHLGYLIMLLQFFATATFMGIGVWLTRNEAASPRCLWWCELVIFGIATLLFAVMHFLDIVEMSSQFTVMPHMPIPAWIILIFAYAVFVPRSWTRVLTVVLTISLFPLLATAAAVITYPNVREMIFQNRSSTIEMVLVLAATVFTAVTSVHMIAKLRARADEARELGRYRLKERIGSGGMGDVYHAEHRLMKRPCAIKVIRSEKAGDPKAIARFEREVQATSRLNHWNSISIYDYGRTADGTFFYVMEYVAGLTVQDLVKRLGPMSPGRVVYLLNQVCNALVEAHSIQLVHRDIKPANLMVTELGGTYDVIKLLDFGLAKPLTEAFQPKGDSQLTLAGSLTGSPLYMAPEQALGETQADKRSDIYALGGVAFYMLTARPPFEAAGTLKVLLSHLNEPAVAPSSVLIWTHGAAVSPALDAIVLKCMAKSPDDRFQSVRELRTALKETPEALQWSDKLAEQWWTSNSCQYQRENG